MTSIPHAAHPLARARIAVVRMSAIGDIVHVLPVICSLRAALPDARITWVVEPVPHQLVAGHDAVDEFLLVQRKPRWRGFRDLWRATRGARFDLVLAMHSSTKASLATSMLDAPRKVGFDRARAPELNWLFTSERLLPRPRGHAQEEALEFVDHLGLPRRLEWRIGASPEERRRFAPLLPPHEGPTIAMVVASSRSEKDWPAERYASLADHAAARFGARLILVGGRSEAEERAAATIAAKTARPPLDLRAWDLRRLACLLESSDAVVSPDSGPMHIAVAVGTPCVALFGYTNPARVGPYRFRELMIDAYSDGDAPDPAATGYRPGRMRRITVDAVLDRLATALHRSDPVLRMP